jgi:hypothetical protein
VVEADGFRNGNNGIDHLFEFNGMLYASTYNYDPNNGGQIWRTMDGLSWQIVVNNALIRDNATRSLPYDEAG